MTAAFGLGGCSATATEDAHEVSGEVRLLVSPVSPAAASGVGFEGAVVVDSGGCIAVGDAALVALPGSKLNGDGTFTLVDPGGGIEAATLRLGDRFRFGGTLAERTDEWVQSYLPAADRCGSRRYLLVFGG